MITSQNGIDLIKEFESLQLKSYICPAGKWTIGYGHTARVKPGRSITPPEAERLLRADLVKFEQDIDRLVRVPLTQGQFDALVSFVFNTGTRAFSTSTLLRKLNGGDYDGAAAEFPRWAHASGQKLAGLERRRLQERRLFES